MTKDSSSRVILITGCSKGIGLASAIAFAEYGDKVYASVRDLSHADALRDIAARHSGRIVPITLDVTSPITIKRAIDDITKRERRLDIVVNNAGIMRSGAFESLNDADVRAVMETNFFGVLNVTRGVLPTMRSQGNGQILMMSSLSGWAGLPGDADGANRRHAVSA